MDIFSRGKKTQDVQTKDVSSPQTPEVSIGEILKDCHDKIKERFEVLDEENKELNDRNQKLERQIIERQELDREREERINNDDLNRFPPLE